jgi:hypothetical protein
MTDYHTVIAQAVESLDQNTSRNRRVLYERARTAQVTHLRAIHPPLSESAIAKERLSLESAIREVEANIAGKPETELRESKPDLAQPHTAAVSLNSEHSERATLRNGPLAFAESETSPLTRPPIGRLRRLLSSKRSQKDERDRSEGPAPSETSTSSKHAVSGAEDLGTANYETQQPEGGKLSYDLDEDQEQPHPAQPLPQAMKAEHLKPLAPLRRHKLVKSVVRY